MKSAPGISIQAVLALAPDAALRNFVGPETIAVLSVLDPALVNRDSLIELAVHSADPFDMLQSPAKRERLIKLLSIEKAQELAGNLGIRKAGAGIYPALIERTTDPKMQQQLLRFFGVMLPEYAPGLIGESSSKVVPSYGLFPHQKTAAERVLRALSEHPYRVVLHMPTGAGKTRTAMHVVATLLNRDFNQVVIWMAQSAELLEQAAEEFEKAWKALGTFATSVHRFWGDYDPKVVDIKEGLLVAGLAKLNALLKRDPNMIMRLGDRARLIVIDEAHQAIAPTHRALITYLKDKKPDNALLGLTATPGRTWANIAADSELSSFFGRRKVTLEVEGYSNPVRYLIEQGYIAKPTFRTLNVDAGLDLSKKDLEDLSQELEIPLGILDKLALDEKRNIRIITTLEDFLVRHSRTLFFSTSVTHAHLISSLLRIRRHESFVITSYTDRVTRESIINRYRSNDSSHMVLCNFGVLTAGFDAPKTSAVVIARPTRSLVLYSQMVGRAIRGERAGGNAVAEVVTVVDPQLAGFGDIAEAFMNWEDVWNEEKES